MAQAHLAHALKIDTEEIVLAFYNQSLPKLHLIIAKLAKKVMKLKSWKMMGILAESANECFDSIEMMGVLFQSHELRNAVAERFLSLNPPKPDEMHYFMEVFNMVGISALQDGNVRPAKEIINELKL